MDKLDEKKVECNLLMTSSATPIMEEEQMMVFNGGNNEHGCKKYAYAK